MRAVAATLKDFVDADTTGFEITTPDSPCGPLRWELVDLVAKTIARYESVYQITRALQQRNPEWTCRDVYSASGLRLSKRLAQMVAATGWPQRIKRECDE